MTDTRTVNVYALSGGGSSLLAGGVWDLPTALAKLDSLGLKYSVPALEDAFARPGGGIPVKLWGETADHLIIVGSRDSWNFLKINAIIRKREDGYHVMSESGKNLGGPYPSMDQAKERLAEVEMFKHMTKNASITDDMEAWFTERTQAHISRVRKYCELIHSKFGGRFSGIIERGESHDASKLQDPEREPYVFITERHRAKREGREFSAPEGMEDQMHAATQHHVTENAHHPEHWCADKSDTINRADRDAAPAKLVDATSMPELDLAEMCADWCAMSEELGNSPQEWADQNIDKRWKFTQAQKNTIYEILAAIWSAKKSASRIRLSLDAPELAFDPKPGQVVAIDYDGTITKNPSAFKDLVDRIHAVGSKAVLLTARPATQRDKLLSWLEGHGIVLDAAHLFPEHYDHEMFDKDPGGYTKKHVAWKSKVLSEIGATDFIDDSSDYAAAVAKNNPEVTFYLAVSSDPVQPWKDPLMPETEDKKTAAVTPAADKSITWDKPLSVDSLLIVFNEEFFDYFLRAPEQPDGYYITDIGDQKVGFGSKYQLRKFLEQLREERYESGTIPELNIVMRPIPTLSSPVVRRLGGREVPVVDDQDTKDSARTKMQPNPPPDYTAITDSTEQYNKMKPSGPMF